MIIYYDIRDRYFYLEEIWRKTVEFKNMKDWNS